MKRHPPNSRRTPGDAERLLDVLLEDAILADTEEVMEQYPALRERALQMPALLRAMDEGLEAVKSVAGDPDRPDWLRARARAVISESHAGFTFDLQPASDTDTWVHQLWKTLAEAWKKGNPVTASIYGGNIWAPLQAGARGSFGEPRSETEHSKTSSLRASRANLDLDDGRCLRWECNADGNVRLRLQDGITPVSGLHVSVDGEDLPKPDAEGWVTLPVAPAVGHEALSVSIEWDPIDGSE